MKYINSKIIAFIGITILTMSCVDDYEYRVHVDKPQDVALSEYLNQFDLLKTYINRNGTPFQLAAVISGSEFSKKEIAYSTIITNFDAVDISGSYDPLSTLQVDGTYNFGGMQTATNAAAQGGIEIYGGALCSEQGQRAEYYNNLLKPLVIPFESEKGKTLIQNFENDPIGTAYPMTGGSTAVVEADPAGESGNVLHVGTNEEKAAYSYPKFRVVLPSGRKLGDYVRLNIDLRFVGTDGIWGQNLRVFINSQEFNLGINGDGFCGGGNNWKREGIVNLKDATPPGLVVPESMSSLTEFDMAIGSASGGAQFYIDNISMDYEVSGGGVINVCDFENDALGTTYPMTGGSTATVENDPAGESGKVLHVGTESDKAAYSHPQFHVVLPAGRKLGDCTSLAIDMNIVNSDGLWGAGMKVFINGQEFSPGFNAAGFGCGNNKWKREGIIQLNNPSTPGTVFPDELNALAEFDLAVGSASGGAQFYLDNVKLFWKADATIIEKTPEEKKEIITKEMEKWIGGMVYAGVNEVKSVKAWNIISNPLDKTVNENTFKWSEYLGETGYVHTAVQIARDTVKNVGVELDLYVSQAFSQYDEMGKSADELIALVKTWEEGNATKIDGYNIPLSAVYSKDENFQKGNEKVITELFEKLGKTGKLIRISNLSMMLEDVNGNYIAINKMTDEERAASISYMSFIMQQYRKLIPANKQSGISISGITETNTSFKICPWTSDYNRTTMYEGIIQGLKEN